MAKCVLCGKEINAPGMKTPCHSECFRTWQNTKNKVDVINMAENWFSKGQAGASDVVKLKKLALVQGLNYDKGEITFPGTSRAQKIKELMKKESRKWA